MAEVFFFFLLSSFFLSCEPKPKEVEEEVKKLRANHKSNLEAAKKADTEKMLEEGEQVSSDKK